MKKVITAGIGGRSFTIDEDAYNRLEDYLNEFKRQTDMGSQSREVMDEVEIRIADLFSESLAAAHQDVVNLTMVKDVISRIGLPDGSPAEDFNSSAAGQNCKPRKKYYRDPDSRVLFGVCSGLAAYLDADLVIIRVLFIVALVFGSAGFWIYLVFWIVAPMAHTALQKCEMRGIPATAENIKRFTDGK